MRTIGLICEGVSEINIMTRILSKYLDDDVIVNPIEPETKTANGYLVQNGYGGWQQVLSHCNDETVEKILDCIDPTFADPVRDMYSLYALISKEKAEDSFKNMIRDMFGVDFEPKEFRNDRCHDEN